MKPQTKPTLQDSSSNIASTQVPPSPWQQRGRMQTNRINILGLACAAALGWIAGPASVARAADLYTSGTKTWDTTTNNWGTITGGPYNTATWNNATPDNAFFEGTAGTVTLGESISVNNIRFNTAVAYTIAGSTLNFASGGKITNAAQAAQTFTSGITGSPSVDIMDHTTAQMTFAPTSASQALGTCTVPYEAGSWDKTIMTLGGTTTGNSVSNIQYAASNQWGSVNKTGSGTWSVGNVNIGTLNITAGNWIETGTIRTYDGGLLLSGGVFHYNNAGAVTAHQGINFSSGAPSLDNSSGAAITTSTYNPQSTWSTGWTFIGSNGANSDLNIGNGPVTLLASSAVTVTNALTTLTIGGDITDGSATYGVTKAGPGTLKLTGVNTYQGATTVNAGTLVITDPSPSANGPVYVASGAKLDLSFEGTKSVSALILNGSLAAAGTWGATSSGAANIDDTYFSGTGIIDNLGGLTAANTWYWDGTNTGGTGDGLSAGGSGTWSTTQTNWDQGFVSRQAWPNTTADSAFFNTVGGTVTLGSPITLGSLDIRGADYTIGGASETNTLNFGGTNTITVYRQNATFNSGISGNPTVNFDGGLKTLRLQPAAGVSMNLGTVNVTQTAGGDSNLYLGGSSAGNSVGNLTWPGGQWLRIYKQGSGTWTVNGAINAAGGAVLVPEISAGTLIISTSGSMRMTQGFTLNGGALHLNNPGAYRGSTMVITSGSLDNSSGAPITTSTWNPAMSWNGNFTFLGSNGANSDLYLGNGAVTMNATRTVTVNSNATLTVGGVVSGATFGLTKSGTGTLKLSGSSTYTGATTVSAGTLAVTGTLGATAVSVNAGTLAGNGNIGGDVTIASGASHALAVAATTGAQVTRAITGTLTLTAGNILDLTAAATPANGEYVLATATNAITGSPTTINYNGITGGTISVDNASSPKRLLLTVASAPPSVTLTGAPIVAVPTTYGTASPTPTSFTVSGLNLTSAPGNLTVTPPSGYEVSLSSGSGYSTSLSVPYSTATLTDTQVFLRLAATTVAGTYAGNISVSGGGASTVTIATVSSNVSLAPLTITGLTGSDKVYNGTTAASFTGTAAYSGLVNAESFSVSDSPSASFATADVGNGKAITISGYTAPSANYSLTQPTLTGNINPLALTFTGSKAYDGIATATAAEVAFGNNLDGVNLTKSGSVTLASAAPGSRAISSFGSLTLGGSAAGNYTLTGASGSVTITGGSMESWLAANYPGLTGDDTLPIADPDNDSLTNLQEFAFGTNPTVSTGEIAYAAGTLTTPGAPKLVAASGTYSMVFGRRADYVAAGLTYTVQFSADLVTWVDNDDVANVPAQVATDGTINVMSVTYPATIVTQSGTPNPKFSRVKVVLAAP